MSNGMERIRCGTPRESGSGLKQDYSFPFSLDLDVELPASRGAD